MKIELAKWIFWEANPVYYCSNCLEKRLKSGENEIRFKNYILCKFYDEATYCDPEYSGREQQLVVCCMCSKQLNAFLDC